MSASKTVEEKLLSRANAILDGRPLSERLEVLEGVASIVAGYGLASFRKKFRFERSLTSRQVMLLAAQVLGALNECFIPLPLGVSALCRHDLNATERRRAGAYYTDFRLAQLVSQQAWDLLSHKSTVIDPAAGSGMLLTAFADSLNKLRSRENINTWLAECVTAWDSSADALRSTMVSLSLFSKDLGAIAAMRSRWQCHDSLLAEKKDEAYDVVLGNPPWEKVKLTRHEFLRELGHDRHYGHDYHELNPSLWNKERQHFASYGAILNQRFPLLGNGDPDLYKAFLELSLRLVRPQGRISMLIPAGVIRSQGAQQLRAFLIDNSQALRVNVLDNKARFFSIDTRFKFLSLSLTKIDGRTRRQPIELFHSVGTENGTKIVGIAKLSRTTLRRLRSDLTIPEVRSQREWKIFVEMAEASGRDAIDWQMRIVREVDMTRDRSHFTKAHRRNHVALIEGRMVHQHRFAAKAYKAGTGRRSVWNVTKPGMRCIAPQFWYPSDALSKDLQQRIQTARIGFCDISGQTNERTLLASVVPAGVVCGNKVPTITFSNDSKEQASLLWLGLANSLPFDWALRRLVTTTVNYFVLLGTPFPPLRTDSLPGRRVIRATRQLVSIDAGRMPYDAWAVGQLRATIDVEALVAYGLQYDDLVLMLGDFPLLDRDQPPIAGEMRSTITQDLVLEMAAKRFRRPSSVHTERLVLAKALGALPYIPSQISASDADTAEAANG